MALGAGAVAGGLTLAGLAGAGAVRLATPRPVAWTVRRLTRGFRSEHPDVPALLDRVRIERDLAVDPLDRSVPTRFDLYRPVAGGSNPTVVWWHGGGFVGGEKGNGHDLAVVLASHGFTVVQPSIALAPATPFPAQLHQGRAVLAHLTTHADELGVDPGLLVLGGDSTGATLAAQLVALHTDPGYAAALDLAPVLDTDALRAAVLYCGIFDLTTVTATGFPLVEQLVWAYLGRRDWRDTPLAGTASPQQGVSARWPQTYLSAGDADPLRPQSVALADALEVVGVPVTRSLPEDSRLGLQHEFQLAYKTVDARAELERTIAFLERAVRR